VLPPHFTVVGTDRCEEDWYVSDNSLRGTLRVVAEISRTRAGSPQAVSRQLCCAVALRRTPWSEHDMGAAWAWHGMASVNHARPHCVNQMGKKYSKPLAARHNMAGERRGRDMGTACYV
jgi:hypothetical protein